MGVLPGRLGKLVGRRGLVHGIYQLRCSCAGFVQTMCGVVWCCRLIVLFRTSSQPL